MTYSTPQLYLVGTAQNLVLGDSAIAELCLGGRDNPGFIPPTYNDHEAW